MKTICPPYRYGMRNGIKKKRRRSAPDAGESRLGGPCGRGWCRPGSSGIFFSRVKPACGRRGSRRQLVRLWSRVDPRNRRERAIKACARHKPKVACAEGVSLVMAGNTDEKSVDDLRDEGLLRMLKTRPNESISKTRPAAQPPQEAQDRKSPANRSGFSLLRVWDQKPSVWNCAKKLRARDRLDLWRGWRTKRQIYQDRLRPGRRDFLCASNCAPRSQ